MATVPRLRLQVAVLAAVAVAAGLAALGYGADRTVILLQHSDSVGRAGAQTDQMFSCLERRLHQQVPAGTRVAIGSTSSLYQQRLVEWSTPMLTVVGDQRDAAVVLVVRRVHDGCNGYDVVVRRTT